MLRLLVWIRRVLLVIFLMTALFCQSTEVGYASNNVSTKAVKHIAVIAYADPFLKSYEGLRSGLRDRGFKLDQEVIFSTNSVHRNLAEITPLLKRFAAEDYDLIYTVTTPVTREVKRVLVDNHIDIPVVFTAVADPVGSGIVHSLSSHDADITGVSHISKELLPKRLLLFKKAFPEIKRIAVFFDPDNEISQSSFNNQHNVKQIALDLGFTISPNRVRNLAEMQSVCHNLTREQVDALFMLPDALSVAYFAEFLKLSHRLKIPLMVIDNMLLNRGGVLGYSPDFYSVGVQAAAMVEQIFSGVQARDIAVQNPDTVKLVVSLKEARALGLTINDDILLQADEVLR